MPQVLNMKVASSRSLLGDFFDNSAPILVEVRFPNMATSSDWHLLHDESELTSLLDKLGAGVEVYLRSVWHLQDEKEPLKLIK